MFINKEDSEIFVMRKMFFQLLAFPVFVLIPLTFITMTMWGYLAVSSQDIFGWERILYIITLKTKIPFTPFTLTPILLIFIADTVAFIAYLYHLYPIYHYIQTGENAEKAEKHIFSGFRILYVPAVTVLTVGYNFIFPKDDMINPFDKILTLVLNMGYIVVISAIYILICMQVLRITAAPVLQRIGRTKLSSTNILLLDQIIAYVLPALFTTGLLLIYFRTINFLFFYTSKGILLSEAIKTQWPSITLLLLTFSILSISLSALMTMSQDKERAPIRHELKQLSKGNANLTHRLVIPSRSIRGVFISLFNQFIGVCQRLIIRLKEYSDKISLGVKDLNSSFHKINISKDAQKKEIEPLGIAVEEISLGMGNLISNVKNKYDDIEGNLKHIDEIANGIEQIISLFQEIKRQSFTSFSTASIIMKQIQESMDKSGQLMQSMTLISEKIQAAGKEAEHIDDILLLVQDISEQTNILSINAAIEAAHAGDDGKGFAIVANEVRTLATESGKAVEQISKKLLDIQKLIRSSVEKTLDAELVTKENNSLVIESHRLITEMINQFRKTDRLTENTAAIISQQGTITRNFQKHIRSLMIFFEHLRNTIDNQEAMFDELRVTLKDLEQSLSTVDEYNNKVVSALEESAKTEEQLRKTLNIFKTE
ncbi:MAG: methyl-accepting chemotaxis protein [Brevinema sp.]